MALTENAFDYKALAERYNIGPEILAELVDDARKDFPGDEMMVELHVIRALRQLERREATL